MPAIAKTIQRPLLTIIVLLALVLFPFASSAVEVGDVPNPRQEYGGWVTDFADILSDSTEITLNQTISELEANNGMEIAVVTVPETAPAESPKAFATELFNTWGIGKKGEDNGVLFLISHGDRRVEIETGYGLEAILPDAEVSNIIQTQIIPRFKQGDFDGGAIAGTEALVAILGGETLQQPVIAPTPDPDIDPRFGSRKAWGFWSQIAAAIAGVNFIFAWIALRQREPLEPSGRSRFHLSLSGQSYTLIYLGSTGAIASLLLFLLSQAINPLQTFLYSFGFVFLCVALELARTRSDWVPLLLMILFFSILAGTILPLSFPLIVGLPGAIPLAHFLAFLAKRYVGKRYRCSCCEKPMKRVGGNTLDAYLTQPNKVARKLGSVKFAGWQCSHCAKSTDLLPLHVCAYILKNSRFQECPTCDELTVTYKTKRILRPTSISFGKRLRSDRCHCCDYSQEIELLTAKRFRPSFHLQPSFTRSSRSSHSSGYSGYGDYGGGGSYGGGESGGGGGSFGGGESGGGGAGGDW